MKICEAGRSTSCCRNPDIRSINTMGADTAGNFEIRAGNSVSITTETNGIRIAYTGGITTYDNTDGNIVIDNDLFTINLADDITITGDMIIAGDLTVNGTYYTVHAEHVYTQDDYIILREGATTPLGAGSYAGFQVTKYDGTNDGRLVVDNAGVARVGDVGDEQPLLTREEAADLTDGDVLVWDSANSKAVGITNNFTQGTGNIGSDTQPVKIVNGVATAVTNALQTELTVGAPVNGVLNTTNCSAGGVECRKYGKLVIAKFNFQTKASVSGTWTTYEMAYDIPYIPLENITANFGTDAATQGWITFNTAGKVILNVRGASMASQNINGSVAYFTS